MSEHDPAALMSAGACVARGVGAAFAAAGRRRIDAVAAAFEETAEQVALRVAELADHWADLR